MGTPSHLPFQRRAIIIAIFHGSGTNCMVPSDWDSALSCVYGPNFRFIQLWRILSKRFSGCCYTASRAVSKMDVEGARARKRTNFYNRGSSVISLLLYSATAQGTESYFCQPKRTPDRLAFAETSIYNQKTSQFGPLSTIIRRRRQSYQESTQRMKRFPSLITDNVNFCTR